MFTISNGTLKTRRDNFDAVEYKKGSAYAEPFLLSLIVLRTPSLIVSMLLVSTVLRSVAAKSHQYKKLI